MCCANDQNSTQSGSPPLLITLPSESLSCSTRAKAVPEKRVQSGSRTQTTEPRTAKKEKSTQPTVRTNVSKCSAAQLTRCHRQRHGTTNQPWAMGHGPTVGQLPPTNVYTVPPDLLPQRLPTEVRRSEYYVHPSATAPIRRLDQELGDMHVALARSAGQVE